MLQRFGTRKTGSRPEAIPLVFKRLYQEFLMNRTFSIVALQSAIAAAIIVAAPLASAESWTEPQVSAPTGSALSRADVRQAALEARDARQHIAYNGETAGDLAAAPFVSTLTRAQVHAEAVEANRLRVTSNHDGNRVITAEELAQIRNAGLRAAQAQDKLAAVR
jgi:hypothetical protein